MNNDIWVSIGAITFVICALVVIIGMIILISMSLDKPTERQQKTRSIAKKMLLFGLIGAVIGFGVCASNFKLDLH